MNILTDFYTKFNTGSNEGTLVPDILDWGAGWSRPYDFWAPARPYTKYCYTQCSATIKTDGTIFYDYNYWHTANIGFFAMNPSNEYFQHLFDLGFVPKIDVWVTNFDCPNPLTLPFHDNFSAIDSKWTKVNGTWTAS